MLQEPVGSRQFLLGDSALALFNSRTGKGKTPTLMANDEQFDSLSVAENPDDEITQRIIRTATLSHG